MGPLDSNLLTLLEALAVAGFAVSGGLAAVERRAGLAVISFVAVVAGLAGGSLRDVLAAAPVFWTRWPAYLAVCLAAAGVVWGVGERTWRARWLTIAEAVGVAAYASVSAARAADVGLTPLPAAALGVLAGVTGGFVRDALVGERERVLVRPTALAAAVAAVAVFVALRLVRVDSGLAALAGAAAGVMLQLGRRRTIVD
jgi:uncharacterized membrane protein YeiH